MIRENESSAGNQQERLFQAGWIVGFVDGEGCFSVSLFKNKRTKYGWQLMPEFVVTQGEKSIHVLKEMQSYFGCGKIFVNRRYDNHKEHLYRYCVRKLDDLNKVIIPFFEEYPLQTSKQSDFRKFCKVLKKMKLKDHYSWKGLQEVASMIGKKIEKESSETTRQGLSVK
jgi:hypothetical protein